MTETILDYIQQRRSYKTIRTEFLTYICKFPTAEIMTAWP